MVTTAEALVEELRRRGVRLSLEGEHLVGHWRRGALDSELSDLVPLYKQAIITLLRREEKAIAWRVEAMRQQVPDRGPVPFLVARREALAQDTPGLCLSCGDPLVEGRRFRCAPCVEAVQRVMYRRG